MNTVALRPNLSRAFQDTDIRLSLKVLLVESDREVRRLLAFVLRFDGHQVVEAADSDEMLQDLASSVVDRDRHHFDLIVCEHSLPTIPGLTVLAALRSRGRLTPFILMTDNTAVQFSARRLGAVIIEQPISIKAIRSAVRQTQAAAQTDAIVLP